MKKFLKKKKINIDFSKIDSGLIISGVLGIFSILFSSFTIRNAIFLSISILLVLSALIYLMKKERDFKSFFMTGIIFVVSAVMAVLVYSVFEKDNNITQLFENRYVLAQFDGLIKEERDYIPSQLMDVYFYKSKEDYEDGNYVRITYDATPPTSNYLESIQEIDFQNYEAQFAGVCVYNAQAHLKNMKWDDYKVRTLEESKGVYFRRNDGTTYGREAVNQIVVEQTDLKDRPSFMLGKCLFQDSSGYFIVFLSYHGKDYDTFLQEDSCEIKDLRKCYNSVRLSGVY